jgi:hypothetical protein
LDYNHLREECNQRAAFPARINEGANRAELFLANRLVGEKNVRVNRRPARSEKIKG